MHCLRCRTALRQIQKDETVTIFGAGLSIVGDGVPSSMPEATPEDS